MVGLAFLVMGHSVYYRKQLPVMNGMMNAMALGMMIGLLVGTMLGTMNGSHLLTSTVWSLLIGLGVGFLSGWPIGGLAMMDGMLSGLMGGMMGAMIGAMLPPSKAEILIRILFVIYVGVIILLTYLIKRHVHKEGQLFGHPFIIGVLFIAFFIGYNGLGPLGISKEAADYGSHESMESAKMPKNIIVTATEFSYYPKIIRAQQGKPIIITLVNAGNLQHDLEIPGLAVGMVHVHAEPGNSESVAFTPKQKGTYTFFCTLPGHKESGMRGKLVVE
jgi:plastocyanin